MTIDLSTELALDGVTVLDASQGVAGPYCGLLMALNGAQVLKAEPAEGDWLRHLGQPIGDHSPHSWYLNRAKGSCTLDLRSEAGRQEALRLAASSDVVITSFRPGAADGLGLSHDAIAARNPQVISCAISGYGPTGALAQNPAVDGVLQAFCGWMDINADAGGCPRAFPYFAIDMLAGLYAYQAVLGALIRQWRHGTGGQRLEVSLMQAAASFLGPRLMELALANGKSPDLFSSPNGAFRTQDGWFLVAVTTQEQFRRVCAALECTELGEDPRFASRALRITHRQTLDALLAQRFEALDGSRCEEMFKAHGAMGAIVQTAAQMLSHPQLRAAGGVLDVPTPAGKLPLVTIPGADAGLQRADAPQRVVR